MTGWRFVKTSLVATRYRFVCPGIRWHIRLNMRGLENVVLCPSTRLKPYLTRPMPKSKNSLRQGRRRSEEHTSELQSRFDLVCRLLLEKKKKNKIDHIILI